MWFRPIKFSFAGNSQRFSPLFIKGLVSIAAVTTLFALNVCSARVSESQATSATVLQINQPIDRELTADSHRYVLRLQAGQRATINVEQRGIDIALQLLANDGSLVAEADDAITGRGTESLDIVADHDDLYSLAVKRKLRNANGAYEIRLSDVRAATDRDRTLFEACKLRTTADRLLAADKAIEALAPAERALSLVQQVLGPDDASIALYEKDVAQILFAQVKEEEARAAFERSLSILTQKLGDEDPQTLFVKSRLGSVYESLEDNAKADRLLNEV